MGKTFRRNEGRRPKWDKRGGKSHKVREFEDGKFHKQHQNFRFDKLRPEDEDTSPQDWT